MIGKLLVMMFLLNGSANQPSWAEDALHNTLAQGITLLTMDEEAYAEEEPSSENATIRKIQPQKTLTSEASKSVESKVAAVEVKASASQEKSSGTMSIAEYSSRMKEIREATHKAISDYKEKKDAFEKDLTAKLNKFGKTADENLAKTRLMDEAISLRQNMLDEHRQKMEILKEREDELRVSRFGFFAVKPTSRQQQNHSRLSVSERIRQQDGQMSSSGGNSTVGGNPSDVQFVTNPSITPNPPAASNPGVPFKIPIPGIDK